MYQPKKAGKPPRWVELKGDWQRDLRDAKVGYNFTVRTARGVPPLSRIEPDAPRPILTPLGELVEKHFISTLATHTNGAIWIKSFVIMPDHLHCCVWVNERIKQAITQYFTKALLFAAKEATQTLGFTQLWNLPANLFMCFSWEIFQQKIAYNEANVDRWKMDHLRRDLSHPHILPPHPKLTSDYEWQGYGHVQLLDEPDFLPCYVSSVATQENIGKFARMATELAKAGRVLIGGFVSSNERNVLKMVREHVDAKVIHVAATRLVDEKVPAQLATSLTNGLFLRITSAEGRENCSRDLCVWQNLWIDSICRNWRVRVQEYFKSRGITAAQEAGLAAFLKSWLSPNPSRYRGMRNLPACID